MKTIKLIHEYKNGVYKNKEEQIDANIIKETELSVLIEYKGTAQTSSGVVNYRGVSLNCAPTFENKTFSFWCPKSILNNEDNWEKQTIQTRNNNTGEWNFEQINFFVPPYFLQNKNKNK